jgi:RNA polymerase sigma factor (sigma-70 family)
MLTSPRFAPTDLALSRAVFDVDPQVRDRAMTLVCERHGPAMTRHAMRILRDCGDSEDAVQEAFVSMVRRGRPVDELRPYLLQLTKHRAIDRLRRRQARVGFETGVGRLDDGTGDSATVYSVADRGSDVQHSVETKLVLRDVLAAIMRLGESERLVVVNHHFLGLSVREASAIRGVTEKTERTERWRVSRKVQKQLATQGYALQ